MSKLQIGAFWFELKANADGTYSSVCVGEVEGMVKRRQRKRFFEIRSISDPEHPHLVIAFPDGQIRCDDRCTGYRIRHNCSHCDEVRKILEKEA